jgi:hypothetical protein
MSHSFFTQHEITAAGEKTSHDEQTNLQWELKVIPQNISVASVWMNLPNNDLSQKYEILSLGMREEDSFLLFWRGVCETKRWSFSYQSL